MALPLLALGAFALSAGSSLLGGRAQEKDARAQAAIAERQAALELRRGLGEKKVKLFESKQLRIAAGQQEAIGRLAASDERRKGELLQSRALAVAGASGAGVSDPDVLRVMTELAKESELAAQMREYEGQDAANKLRLNAKISEWEGDRAEEGAGVSADSFRQQAGAMRSRVGTIRQNTILDIAGSALGFLKS